MRLGGCRPQTCRRCVLGVTGNSEMDRCCEVSFTSWIKPGEISLLGMKEEVLSLVALLLITGAKQVFSYPISARNPAELGCTPLEVVPKKSMKLPSFSWSRASRTQGVN